MVDTSRGTVTLPGVTPGTKDEPGRGAPARRSAGAGGQEQRQKSALEGLRRLAAPRARGGSGGAGGRPTKRPDASGSGRLDLRNTWQILAGSILVPLGVVLILMAWYGAAHTAYVQQQIPYLVSGSFAGLGCLVLGGLLYWAHWLYRLYDQADLHHEEQLKAFEQTLRAIIERVGVPDTDPGGIPAAAHAAGASAMSAGPAPGAATGTAAGGSQGGYGGQGSFVVTSSGSVYHLPSCPVVAHHTEGLRVLGAAGVVDMEPCRICMPAGR